MWTPKKIIGTACSVALGLVSGVVILISIADPDEVLKRLQRLGELFSQFTSAAVTVITVPGLIILVACVVLLACLALLVWSWDGHLALIAKLRRSADDLKEARQKKVRAKVGRALRNVYTQCAGIATGAAFEQVDEAAHALRAEPTDDIKRLAANLLIEYRDRAKEPLRPMMDAQMCDTDADLATYLNAWGTLLMRYQFLVAYTSHAWSALGISPWSRTDYDTWRGYDSKFLAAMEDAAQMPGCEHLEQLLRVEWNKNIRPTRPASAPPS